MVNRLRIVLRLCIFLLAINSAAVVHGMPGRNPFVSGAITARLYQKRRKRSKTHPSTQQQHTQHHDHQKDQKK